MVQGLEGVATLNCFLCFSQLHEGTIGVLLSSTGLIRAPHAVAAAGGALTGTRRCLETQNKIYRRASTYFMNIAAFIAIQSLGSLLAARRGPRLLCDSNDHYNYEIMCTLHDGVARRIYKIYG